MAESRITVKIEGLDKLVEAMEKLQRVQIDGAKIAESFNRIASLAPRQSGRMSNGVH